MSRSQDGPVMSLREAFRVSISLAGSSAGQLRRSFGLFAVASMFLGLSYAGLIPLVRDLARGDTWSLWLLFIAVSTVVSMATRWKAHDFDYSDNLPKVSEELRLKLGRQLMIMPMGRLLSHRTGDLNSIISTNVEDAIVHIGVVSSLIIDIILTYLVVTIAVLLYAPQITLVMAGLFVAAAPLYNHRRRLSRAEFRDLAQANASVESEIIEYIQGLSVLKTNNATGSKSLALKGGLNALWRTQRRHQLATLPISLAVNSLAELGVYLVIGVAAWPSNGERPATFFLAALTILVFRLAQPLAVFCDISSVLDLMEAAFRRISSLLEVRGLPVWSASEASTPDVSTPTKPPAFDHIPINAPSLSLRPRNHDSFTVRFEGVSFRYDQDGPLILKEIDFTLAPKTLTALVGPSGGGKTTITRLLTRQFDPLDGRIVLGGCDIRCFEPSELMSYFSVVFQDVFLFNDTVSANIKLGRPQATEEEVITAAKSANCDGFIQKLTDGYQTMVSDFGGNLSGGEKQRISIARAILKDAPIVILDEPTAALDTENELAVQKAIASLVKDRTILVIAHRLSTIRGADSILVVKDAAIAERGSHAELVAKKGIYFSMCEAQSHNLEWKI